MFFVSVINQESTMKTYGGGDLGVLMDYAFSDLPVGFHYRIYSKSMILRFEIMSPIAYVCNFTNLEYSRHSWVIRKFLEQVDEDLADFEEDDETTE